MQKFVFNLETVRGTKVSNISIMAETLDSAIKRLYQMYPNSRIIGQSTTDNKLSRSNPNLMAQISIVDLITKSH